MNLSDLAAAVRSGRTSASSLVELSLDRIDRLNPPLNAVIRVREQALDDARAMDDGSPRARTRVRSPDFPCW